MRVLNDNDPEVLAFLRDPNSYPHRPAGVEELQTHGSHVFLVEREVFKVKKPVDLGFFDFSTLEKRRENCRREVVLNRRLAPTLYMGAVPITREADGRLRFDGRGEAVEWAVRMRRLPEHLMLDKMIEDGRAVSHDFDRLIRLMAPFYQRAAASPEAAQAARWGDPERVGELVRGNFDETRDLVGEVLPVAAWRKSRAAQCQFLVLGEDLLHARMREGRVVDGHGDLRMAHVCVENGIVVYDCLEFSERYRCTDIACDLAFLAMELDLAQRPDLGRHLFDAYVEHTGDAGARGVVDFYKAYRATVRAKVEGLAVIQKDIPPRDRLAARSRATRHMHLASTYADRFARPRMLLVMGLPGSGKTTAAAHLAERLGAEHLDAGAVRREIAGVPGDETVPAVWGEGLYSREWTDRAYRELSRRARGLLADGASVVVEAAAPTRAQRDLLRKAVQVAGGDFKLLVLEAGADLARERLHAAGRATRADLLPALVQAWEAPAADESPAALDASVPADALQAAALDAWKAKSGLPALPTP